MGNESGQESPISAYFRGAGECCQYRAFGPHPGVLLGGVFFFLNWYLNETGSNGLAGQCGG